MEVAASAISTTTLPPVPTNTNKVSAMISNLNKKISHNDAEDDSATNTSKVMTRSALADKNTNVA